MKPSFAFDTSSLVSLGHTGIVGTVIDNFNITITETIVDELRRVSKNNDSHAKAAMKWLDRSGLLIIRQEMEKRKYGEDELFDICKIEDMILVIDDLKALKRYEDQVWWFLSIHIIYLLRSKGKITSRNARRMFNIMREERNWKDNLIYTTGRILLE